MPITRRFRFVPGYLKMMKICCTDALCRYNRSKLEVDKKIFNMLNDIYYEIEQSYKKHKKIGDPMDLVSTTLGDLMKISEKSRLLCRTRGSRKEMDVYRVHKEVFTNLAEVYEEMVQEVELHNCGKK